MDDSAPGQIEQHCEHEREDGKNRKEAPLGL